MGRGRKVDSLDLDAEVRAAWNQVHDYWDRRSRGKAIPEDDPQPDLASQLFDLYLRKNDSTRAWHAVASAFRMWGNAGCADAVDEAMRAMSLGSPDWGHVLRGVHKAYWRRGRHSDYPSLLRSLDGQLTHPESRSALYTQLGGVSKGAGDLPEARRHYQRVIDLDVTPSEVAEAEVMIYDMDAIQPGREAPDFAATTIDGETIRLASLRGSAVLLDFWATGCGPCHPEFPFLRTLRDTHPVADLYMIGISQDASEQRLREVTEQERLIWPQVREPTISSEGRPELGVVSKLYAVWSIPRTVLIDRQGLIVGKDLRGQEMLDAVKAVTSAGGE